MTIQIKRGVAANLPTGASGEPLWTTDTFEFYIGDGTTNHQITRTFVASGASNAKGYVPAPGASAGTTKYLREDATWVVPPNSGGTVTSVGLSMPTQFTVSNSPVTTSGTLTATLAAPMILANGSQAFTADQPLGANKLTGVKDPTAAQDAATKNYVDLAVQALAAKNDCNAATTVALTELSYTNNGGVGDVLTIVLGVLLLDGQTLVVNNRYLIKNQANAAHNGIWYCQTVGTAIVSPVFIRSLDFDQAGDGINGALVYVLAGTTNANTLWSCTVAGTITWGTTNINWSQFLGTTYTADETTLHLSGTTFSILSTYVGQASITTLGTLNALTEIISDAATNSTSTGATFGHNTSGTAAAGFGSVYKFQLQDSTTASQDAANITVTWPDATHGSPEARIVLNVFDTAAREVMRGEADGANPMIGFLGATASAALASPDLGTLATTFGLATGTPTFTEANLTFTDITTNNVSTSKHGFAPKAPNDATKFLNGANPPAYAVPAAGGLLAFATCLTTSPTSISLDVNGASGGVTLASQTAAANSVWRVKAHGRLTALSSATARNLQMSAFWGLTQLGIITTPILLNTAQSTDWQLEMILVGVDTTHILSTGMAVVSTNTNTGFASNKRITPISTAVSSGAKTIDCWFNSSVNTVADTLLVDQVTIERLV